MAEVEVPLAGGNVAAEVVRVGTTVRKPVTAATPAVEAVLRHLQRVGFAGAPRALGRDGQGRQVLEYVEGPLAQDAPPMDTVQLARVGRLVRDLHEALATLEPSASDRWQVAIPPDREELVCHHDLAPWNLVLGAAPVGVHRLGRCWPGLPAVGPRLCRPVLHTAAGRW